MSIHNRGREQKGKKVKDKAAKIYIFAEGDTELIYLKHFKNRKYGVEIIPVDPHHTDAVGIVKAAKDYMQEDSVDVKLGDRCYCVFDSDPKSNPNIQQAFTLIRGFSHKGLSCIFSNPCFELWFVLHFENPPFGKTAKDMKREIKRIVQKEYPNYSETTDIYPLLVKNHEKALEKAKNLHKLQSKNYKNVLSHETNPYTNIFEFFEYIELVKKGR